MSTKIYNAWRWHKRYDFFDMTRRITVAAKEEVRRTLRKWVRDAKIEENKQARYELLQHLTQHIRVAAVSTLRDPYDVNYRFMVKKAGSYFLCMPTDGRAKYEFLDGIPRLGSYAYWDNTDKPEDISQREWNARGTFWHKYWTAQAHTVEFGPICQMEPFADLQLILCPDLWSKYKKPMSKEYWEDK